MHVQTETGNIQASVLKRAAAGSLDIFILVFCWFAFHSYYITSEGSDMRVLHTLDRAFPVIFILYFTLFEWAWGKTPGKWAFKLKVKYGKSGKPNFKISALRNVIKFFSIFILFAGYLILFFRKDNRAFHDLLSGCMVIKISNES